MMVGDASSDQDALSALKSAEKFLQGVGSVLGENSPHRCHMLNVASDRCCDLQRYGESLTYAIETLPCHALYYGPQHPVHAVQLLRIAKLHLAVDELRDGVEVLLQVGLSLISFSKCSCSTYFLEVGYARRRVESRWMVAGVFFSSHTTVGNRSLHYTYRS